MFGKYQPGTVLSYICACIYINTHMNIYSYLCGPNEYINDDQMNTDIENIYIYVYMCSSENIDISIYLLWFECVLSKILVLKINGQCNDIKRDRDFKRWLDHKGFSSCE